MTIRLTLAAGAIARVLGTTILLAAAIAPAHGQTNGGWTLNIDNTGFNPMPAGGVLPYSIRVDNNGNTATPPTTVAFTIPASTIFDGITGLDNCLPLPGGDIVLAAPLQVTCDVPALSPNAVLNAKVNLRPMSAGTIELIGKLADPGPSFSRKTTVELGADLTVGLSANPPIVQAGSSAQFSAVVTNNGPYPAQGARLVLPLPTGLSPDVSMPAGCAYSAPNITCEIAGPIANGASITLDFSTQVITANASTITIAATIATNGPRDPINTNNDVSTDIAVTPGTDVSLGKQRTPVGLILVGDEVTFTLQPRVAGAPPAQASISDILPANYEFISVAANNGWTCPTLGQTIGCVYAEAAGTNYASPITIVARAITATAAAPGAGVTNTASIASVDENAGAGANNTANDGEAFIAEPRIDLVARKSGPPRGLVTVGNPYDFSLSTRNDGNAAFSGPLTITDHLPAGLTLTGVVAPVGWVCNPTSAAGPADIVCTTNMYTPASPLGPTQQTATIVMSTLVTGVGSIVNGMTVSFDNYLNDDADPANNTTSSGVSSADNQNWADISVIKTLDPDPGPVTAGDPVTFRIEIVNAGPSVATDVVLDDRINDIVAGANGGEPGPAAINFGFVGGLATGMSCSTPTSSGFSRDLLCMINALPVCVAGSGDCPVVNLTVRPGSEGGKQNTAVAFSTTVPDNNTANNTDSASYSVLPRTDVTITKLSAAALAGSAAGQELTYVLTASVPRTGLSAAQNVTISDVLPIGLRFVSAVPSAGSCGTAPLAGTITDLGSQQLTCNLGTISNGAQQTVTVRVIPTSSLIGTSITNEATVSTSTPETDPGNNADDVTVAILPPELDLIISKTDGPDPVEIDTDTHYTITVRNSGPSDAFNLEITDTLPTSGLADPRVAVPPAGGSCTPVGTSPTVPGGTLTCTVPYLAANSSTSITVDMRAVARGRHTNNVTVTSDETRAGYEAPDDNNSSYEDTTVRVRADLEVTKVPSVTTVDLRQEFSWTITVHNKSGPGLDVAEWVTLVDTLPAGMELTALPTSSAGTCLGAIGQRNITCELGDIAAGGTVTITLQTKITEISAQSAANSATASTLSFDQDPSNNTGTGSVNTVLGGSISGTIYRDFNANDVKDIVDTGMGGVTMRVEGIALHDGATITRQFTTVDGTYNFTQLPPGTYSVYYATIGENHLIDGKALPGSGAGTAVASGVNRINSIVVTNAISGTDHDFTRVPVARIGLGKVAGTPVVQADGSYHIPYTLTVRNLSLEPVTGIVVTDILNGASQNFGTFSGGGAPAEGQYRVLSVSGGGFGTVDAGFNGAGANTLLSNGTLAGGATGTVSVTVHVSPVVPRVVPPLVHTNQAEVSGTGQHSGQAVTDLSHNNSNPDPDGNGIANEPGNNMPTTVAPVTTPAITLVKTASFTPASAAAAVGEVVTYSFTVTNTGNTPLLNVTLTDPLVGLVWLSNTPIPRLNPGQADSTTFTASYALTQADLDRGSVPNTATVVGQWGVNSGTPQTVTNSSTATVPALSMPGLTLLKELESSTIGNPRTEVGDPIRYKFTVTNTGNTTLRNVVVADALAGVTADPVGAFTIGTLAPQASRVVYADYAVQLKDINAGSVVNSATANGVHGPGNTAISTPPSAVHVPLYRQPSVALTKSLTSAIPALPLVGTMVTWTVTAVNTGNVTLTNLVVSDPFVGAVVTPANHASLMPGASFDFTVTGPLTQAHINAEEVRNRAKIDFITPGGPGTPVDSNEVITPLPPQSPAIALKKTGDVTGLSKPPRQGEEIKYTIVIRNTGNVPLNNIVLVDLLAGVVLDPADLAALNAAVLQPQNAAGNASGTEITVKASYPLKTSDIEAGAVINTAVVTGVSTVTPSQTVTDRGGTTFETDDPTTTTLDRAPVIRLVKTITSAALSTPPQAGDVITYGFAIHNTGNVTLTDIELTELVSGVTVLNPSGWTGPLAAGASNSTDLTATYALTQADIDRGNFANSAEVAGTGPGTGGAPTTVTDISGTDITNDLPVDQLLTRTTGLSIVKSHSAALSTPPAPGDLVTYSFVVTNTGNVTLTNVVVTDPLADLVMPVSTIATLLPGATNAVTLTASYALKQADIQAGEVRNIASVTGTYTDPVTGPQVVPPVPSNEVVVPLDRRPSIALVKSAVSALGNPAVVGEVITYSFTVTNTGNLDLTAVEINDPLPGLTPNRFVVGNLAPAASQSFTATYAITQPDIDRREVVNQATATGTSVGGPVTDLSGPTIGTDEPVVVPVLPAAPSMTIVKSGSFANGGGYTRVGDVIDYTFVVTNTGNVPLDNVTPRELLLTFGGIAATAATTPITPAPLTLAVGAQATFTTQYVVTQDDINRAAGIADGVSNSADATAIYGTDPVTATQDTAQLSIPPQEPADITISKRALVSTIRRGDTVPYLIVIKNNSLADVGLVTITDRIPAGFVFVEGTATVNDVPVTPVVGGRDVRFDRVALGPNSEVKIGLVLRALASTPPGKYRNIVDGVDALGTPLAPPAHADVLIEAEGVFDCSEVIGTVFDDLNHNGYQDEGEPGIAGVRLSTVRGTLITTDAFGRFSVPCADLPNGNIGSNFVLKLDDRTLPTGYALTTDNPAMVRLTAGKMVELNFGASLGREILLGLDSTAFINGSVATAPALDSGLDQLMALLDEHTTVLTITYTAGSGDQLAQQRVEAILALIRERWRQAGAPYRLIINTDIVER